MVLVEMIFIVPVFLESSFVMVFQDTIRAPFADVGKTVHCPPSSPIHPWENVLVPGDCLFIHG